MHLFSERFQSDIVSGTGGLSFPVPLVFASVQNRLQTVNRPLA